MSFDWPNKYLRILQDYQEKARPSLSAPFLILLPGFVLLKVTLESNVPLGRSTGLTLDCGLAEARQVELVEIIFFVRNVRPSNCDDPILIGTGPLDTGIDEFVGSRAPVGIRNRRVRGSREPCCRPHERGHAV